MKARRARISLPMMLVATVAVAVFKPGTVLGVTTVFFDSSQTTNLAASATTSDTITSEGYLFTLSRDKLFTGGVGMTNPIGRALRVHWPAGLEAQAVTAGPNPGKARMDISREDGELFAVTSFTFQLLANTGGAGAALEIMPMLGGEDARPEPYMYQATGFAGMQFTNNTPELSGYDAYKITLYVDYAVMKLTAVDASPPRPALDLVRVNAEIVEISWPTNAVGYALESATNLPTQAWSPVTNTVVVSGEFFSVQIDRGGSKRFFRLRR